MSDERSNWAIGYEAFAAILLIVIGFFHVFAGIVALVDDEFYVVGNEWTFKFDVTTWGWIHLIVGIVILLAGLGIFTGNVLARTIGVFVAVLSALANFLWLPYYPVWSIVIIALDVAIIWALTVHGRDIVPDRN
ncbi:hypothetical protein BH10ACT3_BH10ACT3_04050 [soil metagenome]